MKKNAYNDISTADGGSLLRIFSRFFFLFAQQMPINSYHWHKNLHLPEKTNNHKSNN